VPSLEEDNKKGLVLVGLAKEQFDLLFVEPPIVISSAQHNAPILHSISEQGRADRVHTCAHFAHCSHCAHRMHTGRGTPLDQIYVFECFYCQFSCASCMHC
jgi:hypothetical protein